MPIDRGKFFGVLGSVVCLGCGLYYVWPTPWIYTRQYPKVNRINRFSGVEETSSPSGWQRIKEEPPPISIEDVMSHLEVGRAKIVRKTTDTGAYATIEIMFLGKGRLENLDLEFSLLDGNGVALKETRMSYISLLANTPKRLTLYDVELESAHQVRLDRARGYIDLE